MNEYRYKFEKGSRKHFCPACNKKRFVRYIDTNTGEYLPERYGRCDRSDNCGYDLNPYSDGYAKMIWEQEQGNRSEFTNNWKPQQYQKPKLQPGPEPVFFDFSTFKQTLGNYDKNVFIQNLLFRVQYPFEVAEVTRVIQLYRLGTVANGYRTGAITFPFVDKNNNVRAIQVKQFDETNHTTGTDFLHSIIEKHHTRNNKPLPEWLAAYTKQEKITCLFGEHLLSRYPNNPIALVEAPKTAVYGTLYFGLPESPENFIWLAVGAKGYLNFDKVKVLKGRFVYVFPDLSKDGNTFREWETKAKDYESRLPGTRFIFSDLLEQLAPEQDKGEGNDLADFLIKQDWKEYRKRQLMEQPQPEPEKVTEVTKVTVEKNIIFSDKDTMPGTPPPERLRPAYEIDFIEWLKQDVKQLPKVNKAEQCKYDCWDDLWSKKKEQPQNWNNEITELETYFANIEPPTQPIKLNQCSTITDYSLFIESHFAIVKANNGKETFLPDLNRLQELKRILTLNSN